MMMSNKNWAIRRMNRDDVQTAIDWAAEEGWNPGLGDADRFYHSDPQGFFVGELADQPIGCISAVSYGDFFGFLGFYIVKPEYRGQGYGIQLWKTALEYMGSRAIGLDGVLAQQHNYIKSGFKSFYRNLRFEGISSDCQQEQLNKIVGLSELPLIELISYDQPMFPAPRPEFLKKWINPDKGAALGYISDGRLKGYGVIRACHNGYRIGPLFADGEYIAEALFKALMSRVIAGQPVFLDVPEPNNSALGLANRFNMQVVFETARMYKGEPEPVDLQRIYGVTSLELG
ncbi:MAG: GNAT family N-acetyltransferase [Syntrophomonas sp.]